MSTTTGKIQYITDENNGIVLPVTHERGVVDSSGVNLQTKLAQKVDSADIDNVVELTQSQYDALATKDARTMYIISDSSIASDHVGIASFAQTTTSTEPGGTNIWTVTLTNNQTFTLAVMNGTQGNSGYSGAASELEVVNNVTDGGATAALSAEMGKQLEGEISQLGLEVDNLGDTLQSEIDAITPIVIQGDVTNAPDEEDITTDTNDLLKFKDRVAGVGQKGYKILRKNATFASQVTDTNTIYEIRYDFDLSNTSVTIPAGCTLKFDGGKVSNGTLTGNGTNIQAQEVEIFDGVTIAGTWLINRALSKWFSADTATVANTLALSNSDITTDVIIDGNYSVLVPQNSIAIPSNTNVYLSGTLTKDSNSNVGAPMFAISGHDVSIFGGTINGNKSAFDTSSGYGHGLSIGSGAKNVLISKVEFSSCRGDGFYIGGENAAKYVTIDSCEIHDCRRNGISVIFGENVQINNCNIHDIDGVSPKAGIDIEPNTSTQLNKQIAINNCKFSNCAIGISLAGTQAKITDVSIINCAFTLPSYNYGISFNKAEFVFVSNCSFTLGTKSSSYGFTFTSSSNVVFDNCNIVSTGTTGNLFSSIPVLDNCYINGQEAFVQTIGGVIHNCTIITPKALCDYASTTRTDIRNCTIQSGTIGLSGRSAAAPAQRFVMTDNDLTLNAQYYPINSNYTKDITIIRNKMSLTGERNLLSFISGNNIVVSENDITINSNQNAIAFTTCTDCEAENNLFTIADGVTYNKVYYLGINTSTSTTNRRGAIVYNQTLGKAILYNGTSWVNVDGSALG